MKPTYLEPTRQSPEQVLVGVLGWPDASATTEGALPGFKEKLWLFGKVEWGGGINTVNGVPNGAYGPKWTSQCHVSL